MLKHKTLLVALLVALVTSLSVLPMASAQEPTTDDLGRRIEIDRGAQIAYAIEDGQIVYSAPVTVGSGAFPTPLGEYSIIRRVANETMDSSTLGIPVDSPDGYYLEDVLYTQYFTDDGVAIHYNYWSDPEAFGTSPESRGCIGMQLEDAEFFWDFGSIGTPVTVTS